MDRSASVPKVLVGKRHDNVVFMPCDVREDAQVGELIDGIPSVKSTAAKLPYLAA